ncbi:Methionyl-tRNA formyltransferase [Oligella urethralis]|uniref:methionyl-tRNA formyltransferase n=1 Tax=Oligella urethralis TaxID=90245 RepID=UPI0029586FEA|nr:methionyl-tRNA formyltransferase [Oligella urethralis]WOS36774.1 Methionyl-tRNA formyltransferase [Oligella urethralis]
MKVVFAGTPEFARLAYAAIADAGFDVPLVMTQPDRRAGRGMKLSPSAVKQEALARGAELIQPLSLRLDGKHPEEAIAAREALKAVQPDVIVVAAYGLILPQWTLDLAPYGCLNIHASLLPRWRGAAPIQRAIEAGDEYSGIGIMQMEAGLDTGPVLLEKQLKIGRMNAAQLHDALASLGAEAIVEVLTKLAAEGDAAFEPSVQAKEGVTYAAKLTKEEALLDWAESAMVLERRIRAFTPVPGARVNLAGFDEPVKVWSAELLETAHELAPGTILARSAEGVDVACGQGALRLTELQRAGGRRQTAEQFIQGWRN